MRRAHESLLIVPQIETVTAVRNAGAIAAIDGVDMLFIGPSDLSGSAGLLDQTGAPEVERLIAETVAAVRAAGKPLATVPRDGKSWQALFDDGYAVVASGSDIAIFRAAAAALAEEWRGHRDRRRAVT